MLTQISGIYTVDILPRIRKKRLTQTLRIMRDDILTKIKNQQGGLKHRTL